jgi:ribonuclease R
MPGRLRLPGEIISTTPTKRSRKSAPVAPETPSRTVQKSRQVKTPAGAVSAKPIKTAAVKSTPAKAGPIKAGPVKAGSVKAGSVNAVKPKSANVKSVKAAPTKPVAKRIGPKSETVKTTKKLAAKPVPKTALKTTRKTAGQSKPVKSESVKPEPVEALKPVAVRRATKKQVVLEPVIADPVSATKLGRGRKPKMLGVSTESESTKATPEPILVPVKLELLEAQSELASADDPTGDPTDDPVDDTADDTAVISTNSETVIGENIPSASPALIARSRRTGRTSIFESQIAPLDPIEALLEYFRANPKPHQARDLIAKLPAKDLERLGGRKGLETTLDRLVIERRLTQPRRLSYALASDLNLIVGRFQTRSKSTFTPVVPSRPDRSAHRNARRGQYANSNGRGSNARANQQSGRRDQGRDGFFAGNMGGIVTPETPGLRDLLVEANNTLAAWNGDRVVIREERNKGSDGPQGKIIRILERSRQTVVGTLEYAHGYAILRPDERRLPRTLLLPEGLEDIRAGARLTIKLFWPEHTGEDEAYGQVLEMLGSGDSPEVETRAVIQKFGLHEEFSVEALAESEKVTLAIPESALEGRSDLRSKRIFTIDGSDAKDFDDAIHIEPLQNGHFLVGIHVADVSHYVIEGAALDREAQDRATSVYLPGKVLPMLPEHLSNGVCSLKPGEDRLAMSVLLQLTANGEIVNTAMVNSVIHSRARLTYDEVQAFSEGKSAMPDHARDLEGDLHLLLKLTTRLREKRFREGSLDFRLREVRVDVAADGTLSLVPVKEETARGLIEDLMLLANRTVAEYLHEREIPVPYRVHEEPNEKRFLEVTEQLGKLGLTIPGGKPTPQAYQEILVQVRDTPQERTVNNLLLRSMRQARYASKNLGHFGLAFSDYLHFTSPIRRYPDLIVHRILKQSLARKLGKTRKEALEASIPALTERMSERERNASDAERDLTRYYQCRWAMDHSFEKTEESFKGSISGITPQGMYVTLENGVEGLLADSGNRNVGIRNASKPLRLGSSLRVQIESVNAVARQIDLKEFDMDKTNPRRDAKRVRTQHETHGTRSGQADNRRVVVLHGRPKGEHSRPVKVTARSLYFGEWVRPSEEDGENNGNARPNNPSNRSPNQQARGGQPQPSRGPKPQGRPPQQPRVAQPTVAPLIKPAIERNQNRTQAGPAEGTANARPVRARPQSEGQPAQVRPPQARPPQPRPVPAPRVAGAQPAQPANAASLMPATPDTAAPAKRRRRRRRRTGGAGGTGGTGGPEGSSS